jgi:hypothetical protein
MELKKKYFAFISTICVEINAPKYYVSLHL